MIVAEFWTKAGGRAALPPCGARLAVMMLALALLWLSPLPAAARGAPTCEGWQVAKVAAAFTQAEIRTEAALAFLDAAPDHPHVVEWFGKAPREKVRAKLVATLERLRPGKRPAWTCAGPTACGGRNVFAVAWLLRDRIGLCRLFFEASPEKGPNSRRGVIVHEVSHLAAGTIDAEYGLKAARALARKDPLVAMRNADNIEYFVELMPEPVAAAAGPAKPDAVAKPAPAF